MSRRTIVIVAAVTILGVTVATPALGNPWTEREASQRALAVARQTLPSADGWGAAAGGTTGGAAADDAQVFVVRTRGELVAALGGDNATNAANDVPKIVLVKGTIDMNTDDEDRKISCSDYADPAYDQKVFLSTYDPAVWGKEKPTGPLEDARKKSAGNQSARVMINVGSNTTILGLTNARILGGNLLIGNPKTSVSNVIVRNLTFTDAYDCFPAWSPTDGTAGNWNSLYDNVSLIRATNVWLDHNTLSDGKNTDDKQPLYFGRPYQVHDALSDITKGSDYVTVSYNIFRDHDKLMIIGATDKGGDPATDPLADLGRLRVTLHHNLFENFGQRAPRVRFGQVDVYNNYYHVTDKDTFVYAWGAGVDSALYAENNFFQHGADVPVDDFVYNWGGKAMTEKGTLTRVGTGKVKAVSLLDSYNAANTTSTLGTDAGWTPTLRAGLNPAAKVPAIVKASAGVGKLRVR